MKQKNFEETFHKVPFTPFYIHSDGKTISVEHPDQVLFSHDRGTVVVAPRDNRFHIIEVDRIEFVTLTPPKKTTK